MADHGIELLGAGELLGRLAECFPDKVTAADETTVNLSRRSAEGILSILELIAGKAVADFMPALTTGTD
jgi:hypothetical protein